jgi:hypothetical protein
MDFNGPPNTGLVTPMPPPKHAAPADDGVPTGADWFVWDLTIGPAESCPSSPNPMSVQPPGIDTGTSLLAEQLNWKT